MREVDLTNALFLVRALRRTQRLMDVGHYLDEHDLAPSVEGLLRNRLDCALAQARSAGALSGPADGSAALKGPSYVCLG